MAVTWYDSTTLNITGLWFDPDPQNFLLIEEYSTARVYRQFYTPDTHAFLWDSVNKRVTVTGADFTNGGKWLVLLWGPQRPFDVALQDQHTRFVVSPLYIDVSSTTLAVNTSNGDSSVELTVGHGASVGNILVLREGIRYYWGTILSVSTNTIGLDTPLDFAFTTSADVDVGDANLNKNGTLLSPVIAHIKPPPGVKWDITRVHTQTTSTADMDSGRFGSIPALTNGCVFGKVNGEDSQNIANVKTNGDLGLLANQDNYDPKAPAGVYGYFSKHQFGGQTGVGVVIRLEGDKNDQICVLIQDDLTSLLLFRVIAIGHVVDDWTAP